MSETRAQLAVDNLHELVMVPEDRRDRVQGTSPGGGRRGQYFVLEYGGLK